MIIVFSTIVLVGIGLVFVLRPKVTNANGWYFSRSQVAILVTVRQETMTQETLDSENRETTATLEDQDGEKKEGIAGESQTMELSKEEEIAAPVPSESIITDQEATNVKSEASCEEVVEDLTPPKDSGELLNREAHEAGVNNEKTIDK